MRRVLVSMPEDLVERMKCEVWAAQQRGDRRASFAKLVRQACGAWLEGRSEGLRDKRVTLKRRVK